MGTHLDGNRRRLRNFHLASGRVAIAKLDFEQRQRLARQRALLADRFWANEPIEELILALSQGVDAILLELFEKHLAGKPKVALYAVGGYGREELHPGSDIDILLVAAKPQRYQAEIQSFLQDVFDLNLEVGHAVRTAKECRQEAKQDITVATAIFERRFLAGDRSIVADLDKAMSHRRLWPIHAFFKAKSDEQTDRHKHYDNTEYNLEPNVKTSPGGLRDIHTALWICQRHFHTNDPQELVSHGVLTQEECNWLVEGRRFIWWVRYGLHLIAERKEDQLQFALQRELAQRFGYSDTGGQKGVERFMHDYYRHVIALTEVNDILIQHFQESILPKRQSRPVIINDRFQTVDGYLEVRDEQLFHHTPSALLEMFVVMANRTDIGGVRVNTIRAIRGSLDIIDDSFRNNEQHVKLFMDLLKAPYTLVSQLTRMRRYGILGRYIPEFGKVVGQMQHDLFHIYTVDAHTMAVIRNMRRFRYRASRESYPVAYHCVHQIPKLELLYLAGLFHDIGKGRGGDHSVLGAVDAEQFCQRHNLSQDDTDLVVWLVKKHLYMSTVSQRQDIYDPDVVHAFANEVKSERRLDYLYALTVADINATNPTLWNSWRATLLHQLYTEARRVLRRGLESPADKEATIAAYAERAMERMVNEPDNALDEDKIRALWATMGEDFLLRHTAPQIASISKDILAHNSQGPYVAIYDTMGDLAGEGASRVYIYTADQDRLFANTVSALSQMDLSVVDATVHTDAGNMCFDTYTVLTDQGSALPRNTEERQKIIAKIKASLAERNGAFKSSRRLPRRLRDLPIRTEVEIKPSSNPDTSEITVVTNDRPGLLATIAAIFVDLGLEIKSARIATLGERVEDTFEVTRQHGGPIAAGEDAYQLQATIRQHIDQAVKIPGSKNEAVRA